VRQKAILTANFLDRKLEEYRDLKEEIERLETDLGVREEVSRD
jgi:hypothetical protein